MQARAMVNGGNPPPRTVPSIDIGAVRTVLRSYLPAVVLLAVILACASLLAPFASAAEGTNAVTSDAPRKIFSADLSAEIGSSLHERNNAKYTASASFEIAPSVRLSDSLSLTAVTNVEHELTDKRETHLRNTTIGLRRNAMPISKIFSFSPGVSVVLPTDKEAKKRSSLLTSVGITPRILFDLAPAGMPAITGYAQLGATRSFHEYKTALGGASNRPWGLTPMARITAAISQKISVTAIASYAMRWTYGGNRVDDFELTEELSWQTGNNLWLGIGHSNSGSAQRADGMRSNVEFFDANTSNVFANITVSI